MKSKKLQNAMGMIDEELVLRADKKPKKHIRLKWISAVAAMLAVALVIGIFFGTGGPMDLTVYAIEEAQYPEMAPYPKGEWHPDFEKQFDAWWEDQRERRQYYGASKTLSTFIQRTASEMLTEAGEENRVYSPLNIYMALAMLAETTAGESRSQILSLIGAPDMETLREQAYAIWRANYSDDDAVSSLLASSMWLNEDVSFNRKTLETIAETYFASSYRGKMGSEEFNEALQNWLNEQTGGLLKDFVSDVEMPPETIMAIATTIYFRAKWENEFEEKFTETDVFHGANRDVETDFMHCSDLYGVYYWGEKFSATTKPLEESGKMLFILPDEGVSIDALLTDGEALSFLTDNASWENKKSLIVNLAVPKFDVSSKLDLVEDLKNLGITDCFSISNADFSPLLVEEQPICLAEVEHGARVAIDEEGVIAAAYTVMVDAGAAMPPTDVIDFTLDRPFLFAITGADGSILFVGIVNQI